MESLAHAEAIRELEDGSNVSSPEEGTEKNRAETLVRQCAGLVLLNLFHSCGHELSLQLSTFYLLKRSFKLTWVEVKENKIYIFTIFSY